MIAIFSVFRFFSFHWIHAQRDGQDAARRAGSSARAETDNARHACKKYPYMYGYFVVSLHYFNGTGSVYVGIRNSTE